MDKFASLFAEGGISLDRLRNFCLIADAGGITKAADGDPGRISLYSRQIRELETFFGVELKRRLGKGIVLSDAGRRLAGLVRAQLVGLEDFRQEARKQPRHITIAAGNSIIEWMILPCLPQFRKRMPGIEMEIVNARTREIVSRLEDLSLDFAIVREDAIGSPLKSRRIGHVSYAVFLPKRMATGMTAQTLKANLAAMPLATSMGGQFREQLEKLARKAKWKLHIELSCSTFTHAARAMRTGAFGAVLPTIAASDFPEGEAVQFPLPFLKAYARPLCIAWNPRLLEIRPFLEEAIDCIHSLMTARFG